MALSQVNFSPAMLKEWQDLTDGVFEEAVQSLVDDMLHSEDSRIKTSARTLYFQITFAAEAQHDNVTIPPAPDVFLLQRLEGYNLPMSIDSSYVKEENEQQVPSLDEELGI